MLNRVTTRLSSTLTRYPALGVLVCAALLAAGLAVYGCQDDSSQCDGGGPYYCDPDANYNAPTSCEYLGFVGGSTNLPCTDDCHWDVEQCHNCGDDVCGADEDPQSCPADCPGP